MVLESGGVGGGGGFWGTFGDLEDQGGMCLNPGVWGEIRSVLTFTSLFGSYKLFNNDNHKQDDSEKT